MTQSSTCDPKVMGSPEYYWVQCRDKDNKWGDPTVAMLYNGLWYVIKKTWFYKDHEVYVLERIPHYTGDRRVGNHDGT